jgi:hypothetical protein
VMANPTQRRTSSKSKKFDMGIKTWLIQTPVYLALSRDQY